MKITLCRYERKVTVERLGALLIEPKGMGEISLGIVVDLGPVLAAVDELPHSTPAGRAQWDKALVKPLHQALMGVQRRDALDMRVWHWLCISVLPQLVWTRWLGRVPASEEILGLLGEQKALASRFLGSDSLNGVSRNALARLWWGAEHLSDGGTDYTLAENLLGYQDFYQAIFERQFGLYPPAAKACVRALLPLSEKERREACKRLNLVLTTVVAEALDEEDFFDLLTG